METHIPGGVYLCQVSDTVSCGACCGLYNVSDNSRKSLHAILAARTDRLGRLPRTIDGIDAFSRWVAAHEDGCHPLPDFHHCPFIGLIGKDRSRVGCLLHPLADKNQGQDFRGLSHYGGMACRMYFCPSHEMLSNPLKQRIKESAMDWYAYGLLITEHRLLNSFWQQMIQNRPSDSLSSATNPETERFQKLMGMKIDWPFRAEQNLARIHYFFNDGLYSRPEISCHGPKASRWAEIFQELGSYFPSPADMNRAEMILDSFIR